MSLESICDQLAKAKYTTPVAELEVESPQPFIFNPLVVFVILGGWVRSVYFSEGGMFMLTFHEYCEDRGGHGLQGLLRPRKRIHSIGKPFYVL